MSSRSDDRDASAASGRFGAASVALAGVLIATSDARAWAAATMLAALAIVAYVLSRTTGLPQSSDDVGNWSEPLGVASLFVEGSLVALSSGVLLARWTRRAARAFEVADAVGIA